MRKRGRAGGVGVGTGGGGCGNGEEEKKKRGEQRRERGGRDGSRKRGERRGKEGREEGEERSRGAGRRGSHPPVRGSLPLGSFVGLKGSPTGGDSSRSRGAPEVGPALPSQPQQCRGTSCSGTVKGSGGSGPSSIRIQAWFGMETSPTHGGSSLWRGGGTFWKQDVGLSLSSARPLSKKGFWERGTTIPGVYSQEFGKRCPAAQPG